MLTNNLGYPRVGANRELKKACEQYWAGQITRQQLFVVAKNLREQHWRLQRAVTPPLRNTSFDSKAIHHLHLLFSAR